MNISPDHALQRDAGMNIATDDYWIERLRRLRDDLNASREWTNRCRDLLFAAVAQENQDQEKYDQMVREHGRRA
jgi:hypothetical protein